MLLLQLHTLSVVAKKDYVRGYNRTPAPSASARLELSNCKDLMLFNLLFLFTSVAKSLVVYRQNIDPYIPASS